MSKSKDVNDPEKVTEYIGRLEPAFAELIETIRRAILDTDSSIGEQIKWNSPSFFYAGEMAPFDPKEYKRDIVVINIRKGVALLVFPTGARIPDTTGLLEGNYTDGRRMVTFRAIAEVHARATDLQQVIRQWLDTVER